MTVDGGKVDLLDEMFGMWTTPFVVDLVAGQPIPIELEGAAPIGEAPELNNWGSQTVYPPAGTGFGVDFRKPATL
jgi:hypothetical protein